MEKLPNSNLRFARENFKYTTRSLSSKINFNYSNYSKFENGHRIIPSEIIEILANTLECSFEFVMNTSSVGLYAYYMDKKLVLSIEEYKDLESKNLIEVVDYKRVISSDVEIKNLIPLVYGISKN